MFMEKTETLEAFYQVKLYQEPGELNSDKMQFNIPVKTFPLEHCGDQLQPWV